MLLFCLTLDALLRNPNGLLIRSGCVGCCSLNQIRITSHDTSEKTGVDRN